MSHTFRQQKEYEKDLCKIIQIIYFYEEKLEKIRITLCESARFNIVLLFFKISRMKNHITKNDLRSFFAINHQPVIEKECDYIVFNYGSNQNNCLFFEDFTKLFTPRTNKELISRIQDQFQSYSQGTMQIPQNEISQTEIPFFIEDISIKLLQLELKFFRELEAQKMFFSNKYGTNILTAFQNISAQGHSYDIIHKLFHRNGYTFTSENFNYLMFRIDKDGNGIISKDEFLDEKFILPSYRFASYTTSIQGQKDNPPSTQRNQYNYENRVPTPGTFRNMESTDQKAQFSFLQRPVLNGEFQPQMNTISSHINTQLSGGQGQNIFYFQNDGYNYTPQIQNSWQQQQHPQQQQQQQQQQQFQQLQNFHNMSVPNPIAPSNKENQSTNNQISPAPSVNKQIAYSQSEPHEIAQQEFIQQRLQNHIQQVQSQQASMQQIQPPAQQSQNLQSQLLEKQTSLSIHQQQKQQPSFQQIQSQQLQLTPSQQQHHSQQMQFSSNPEVSSQSQKYQQHYQFNQVETQVKSQSQNVQYSNQLEIQENMYYGGSGTGPNSPNNFEAINDSHDHINQIYVKPPSQSNIAQLSSKKIN